MRSLYAWLKRLLCKLDDPWSDVCEMTCNIPTKAYITPSLSRTQSNGYAMSMSCEMIHDKLRLKQTNAKFQTRNSVIGVLKISHSPY